MPGVNGPVCLARSPPADAYAGHLMFYDVVPPRVVSRSSVLSSVVEAGGDARLPDVVTLSDFKTWANLTSSATGQLEIQDMVQACTVLKVADALDDACFERLLQSAAHTLRHDALAHSKFGQADPQHLSEALIKLPEHLQRDLFETVMRSSYSSSLGLLLNFLPSHHHSAIVAAAITPDKKFTAPQITDVVPVAEALAQLPASPPSLLRLHLESEGRCYEASTEAKQRATAAVAAGIRHHSSLTSLSITSFHLNLCVAKAIASLSGLQALELGGHAGTAMVPVEDIPLLKNALSSLSRLEDLKFSVEASSELHSSEMHECGAGPLQQPQHSLSSLLSAATALTSLDIEEVRGPLLCFNDADAPLSLPRLRNLKITSCHHNVARVLLSQLCAPLAALEVRDEHSSCWQPDDLHRAEQLWTSLAKFTQLGSLSIDLDMASGTDQVHRRLLTVAPAAITSLRCLRELNINASLPMLLRVTQQLAHSRAGLHRLEVHSNVDAIDSIEGHSYALWTLLLCQVNRLRLHHLDIHASWCRAQPPPAGLMALRELTQLTALHLCGWARCLHRHEDVEALAGMQQLRTLRVIGLEVPAAGQADCVRTLGALPSLSQLALRPAHASAGWGAAFVKHAPEAKWRALQALELSADSLAEAGALVRVVAALPSLQHLTLGSELGPSSVSEGARDGLRQLASEAGISLAFDPGCTRLIGRSVQ